MSRPWSRVTGGPSRAYLVEYVEGDRVKHVLDDDSKYRVGSALGFAGARHLVLPRDSDLAVRILQQGNNSYFT